MALMEKVYLGPTPCFLCKENYESSYIMNFEQHCEFDASSPNRRVLIDPSIWAHEICYIVFSSLFQGQHDYIDQEDILEFAKATRLLYYNPQELEGSRRRHANLEGLSSQYAKEMREFQIEMFDPELFAQFPAELKLMIVDLIGPCWYLTVIGETRRLYQVWRDHKIHDFCTLLTLSEPTRVYKITYRGIPYVTELRKQDYYVLREHGKCCLKAPDNLRQIVLSMDGVGIRRIQLVTHDSEPVSDGSPWYKILNVSGSRLDIMVEYGGLFVRDIELVSNCSESTRYNIWSSPVPPKADSLKFRTYGAKKKQYRMHYEKLDDNVKGLVVCCAKQETIGLHAFSEISKSYQDFVCSMHRRACGSPIYWVYFPLNRNEHIGHLIESFISKKPRGDSCSVVSLITSLGRGIRFGPHIPQALYRSLLWRHLLIDNEVATGFFHDSLDPDSYHGIVFGATKDDSYSREKLPETRQMYEPPQLNYERASKPCWYLTKASLNGLVRMQLCRDQGPSHCPCIGLLLFYDDQHIESLGEVRWEFDMTQEVMAPAYIETNDIDGEVYIKDVRSREPQGSELDDDESAFVRLPESGTIKLWFDQVYGNGYIIEFED